MKKEIAKAEEEKKLVWKMKDLPTAEAVASLVETQVITPEEARAILFKEEVKQSEEVEALKEMVNTLQEMVKALLARSNDVHYVPFTKVINVPANANPYWNRYWSNTSGATTLTTHNGGTTTYTLSI